ncbi:MAG: alpha/beta hydrolase, partial [Clostridia bacterium]|nr:alpha/beta hydrolase [Clostridia bacterium]
PFTVDKVVLVDAAGVLPEKSPWEKFKQKLIALTGWFFKLAIIQKLFPNALENLRKRSGSADYNAASPLMRQTLVRVVNEDLCDLMPHVTCPALLIWGTADTATPLSDAVKMNSLMPESAIVKLEGAGHFSFLEQQPRYLRILASFLNVT